MTRTPAGLFDGYADARRAVQDLEAAGVPHRDVGVVAYDAHRGHGHDTAATVMTPRRRPRAGAARGPVRVGLFRLGVTGTGSLAAPVLAGSAGWAVGETRGWTCGLDQRLWQVVGFGPVIALAPCPASRSWTGADIRSRMLPRGLLGLRHAVADPFRHLPGGRDDLSVTVSVT